MEYIFPIVCLSQCHISVCLRVAVAWVRLLNAVLHSAVFQIIGIPTQGEEKILWHGAWMHTQRDVSHNSCYTPTKIGAVTGGSGSMETATVRILNTALHSDPHSWMDLNPTCPEVPWMHKSMGQTVRKVYCGSTLVLCTVRGCNSEMCVQLGLQPKPCGKLDTTSCTFLLDIYDSDIWCIMESLQNINFGLCDIKHN